MTTKAKIALGCNIIAILIITLIALVYLFTPQLLPYQEAAIGTPWSELEPGFQVQFLSLMKVSGGGYLATAASLFVMLVPLFRGKQWARIAVPAIGIPAVLIVNYAGLTVMMNTPGQPPLIAGPAAVIFFIAGFVLSSGIRRSSPRVSSL